MSLAKQQAIRLDYRQGKVLTQMTDEELAQAEAAIEELAAANAAMRETGSDAYLGDQVAYEALFNRRQEAWFQYEAVARRMFPALVAEVKAARVTA